MLPGRPELARSLARRRRRLAAAAEALTALLDEGGRLLVDVGRRPQRGRYPWPEPAPPRRGPAARLLPCPARRRRRRRLAPLEQRLLPLQRRRALLVAVLRPVLLDRDALPYLRLLHRRCRKIGSRVFGGSSLLLLLLLIDRCRGRGAGITKDGHAVAVAFVFMATELVLGPLDPNGELVFFLLQPMVAVSWPLGDVLLLVHGQAVRQEREKPVAHAAGRPCRTAGTVSGASLHCCCACVSLILGECGNGASTL
jgi:hypothetical protein